MVAVTALRTLGQHLHPVGPLTVANMVKDPDLIIADGSNNLTQYNATNCTFKKDATQFKFGTTSGKFTVTSTVLYPSVIQSFTVSEIQDYTASMYIKIPTNLSTGLSIFGQLYAPDSTPMGVVGGQVLNGIATSGFIRTSILLSTPPGAARMDVAFIFPSSQPTALDSFYVDGLQLEPYSTVNPYVNGDMSGYCWQGTAEMSNTLQTQFPDALRAFQVGALNGAVGGMTAHATMTRPNVLPIQS